MRFWKRQNESVLLSTFLLNPLNPQLTNQQFINCAFLERPPSCVSLLLYRTALILPIGDSLREALMEECHKRGVKSCFSSPYKPQQDYAEGYIGRITTMASFAMVLSGAPLWMWRWAIQCGAFINNITATHYRKEGIWGTPWELQHGEPFPDSSIVVPFGCGALVMLTRDEREKFRATCAMMIFVHYALDHPLYTYAFFSPRTKRVIFRQDVIFLPSTFPMREARTRVGMIHDGRF